MNKEQKNVRLVKIDTKNFDALIDLEVNEEQKTMSQTMFTVWRKPMPQKQKGKPRCHLEYMTEKLRSVF